MGTLRLQGVWGIAMRETFVLQNYDVVYMDDGRRLSSKTARACEIMGAVLQKIRTTINSNRTAYINDSPELAEWVTKGVECEVISETSEGWMRGRVRVCIEFIPDGEEDEDEDGNEDEGGEELEEVEDSLGKPLSPLDDLRSQLNIE
jgi:KGK domain